LENPHNFLSPLLISPQGEKLDFEWALNYWKSERF
jgi:hypothetical protein